ncbi:MAG: DUF5627 domain-containing protein [Leeuwenhoekiella sp.]
MKYRLLTLVALVVALVSCDNQDVEFDDFGTTAVFFPFQTPARTLILGNYERGINENDNNSRFEIGVSMSGVYTNDIDRQVGFRVAPELLENVENVMALPENYYTIETTSPVTIPTGSITGRISIQLNEAFFKDTLSFAPRRRVNYVVPLLITDIQNLDTLLVGLPEFGFSNPSRVNDDEWEILPKDYTLYGIKFINKYEAIYLRRGVDVATDEFNETVVTEYRAEFVVRDELVKAFTSGENAVELSNRVRRAGQSPGNANFELVFDEDGNCTISSFEDDIFNVTGTGRFVEDGDTWGGKLRDVIYLDYSYADPVFNETHSVKDTLVVRNRDVVFEQFSIDLLDD